MPRQQNGAAQPKEVRAGAPQLAELGKVLFCEPHRGFWVGGFGRIEANEHGELDITELDAETMKTLLNAGCRKQR